MKIDWKPALSLVMLLMMGTGTSWASAPGHGKSAAGGNAHWGYEGREGPDNWGRLSSAYELCGKGHNQSPVNIVKPAPHELDSLDMSYDNYSLKIVNNGHTIQVNVPDGKLHIAGETYDLLQYHFHTPSEHRVDGDHAPMEVHFVHKSAEGRLAVVGVMMRKGRFNTALDRIWRNMPSKAGETVVMDKLEVSPFELMPKSRDYYHYNGSLTTPPCSEGVRWFVLADGIEVAAAQIERFKQVVGENSRPTQPLHERHVRVTK